MFFSKVFARIVLLLLIPSLVAYPVGNIPINGPESLVDHTAQRPTTLDDFLELLDELEEGALEERISSEEIDQLCEFVVHLAYKGVSQKDPFQQWALESDIMDLRENTMGDKYDTHGCYAFVPAMYYYSGLDSRPVLPCKTWVKKQCKHVKKFVKKHKKEILIGAAVIAAVVIVACVVSAAAASTTVAGAAAASASDEKSKPKPEQPVDAFPMEQVQQLEEPHPNEDYASSGVEQSIQEESPFYLASLIQKEVNAHKEAIENNFLTDQSIKEATFTETAREVGSFLAHETIETVSDLVSVIPELLEDVHQLHQNMLLEGGNDVLEGSPSENFYDMVAKGHDAIDRLFSTDQAEKYASGVKEKRKNGFVIGVIPLGPEAAEYATLAGRIPKTEVSLVKGWKVGDKINNRTKFGGVPKWSTVRSRHWKNQAERAKAIPNNQYTETDIARMERGLAPQRYNKSEGKYESKELHHDPAQKDGGLFDFIEVWPDEHADIDSSRHLGG